MGLIVRLYSSGTEDFVYRSHTYDNTTLPYRLFIPENPDSGKKYPLVLALHGADERGDDNEGPVAKHRLALSWADSANQAKWSSFVLVPQCPQYKNWVDGDWSQNVYDFDNTPISNELETVMNLLDSLLIEFPIDTTRIFVTGLSMGGYGTWDLITRFPHRFAAAVPMSGVGDSTRTDVFLDVPIWVFHGEKDNRVSVSGSRYMVSTMEKRGRPVLYTHCKQGDCTGMSEAGILAALSGGADLIYTEWPDEDHDIWAQSYDYPFLFPWVFSHGAPVDTTSTDTTTTDTTSVDTKNYRKLKIDGPDQFEIYPAYPNPFNPKTTIMYELQRNSWITLEVFDALGRRVRVLIDQEQAAGFHRIAFDGSELVSGVFVVCLTAGGRTQIQKVTLVR